MLEISDRIIADHHLTAMMVTHNMKDAIVHGNRLIMMHEGRVILNIAGEEKKKLTVEDLPISLRRSAARSLQTIKRCCRNRRKEA